MSASSVANQEALGIGNSAQGRTKDEQRRVGRMSADAIYACLSSNGEIDPAAVPGALLVFLLQIRVMKRHLLVCLPVLYLKYVNGATFVSAVSLFCSRSSFRDVYY